MKPLVSALFAATLLASPVAAQTMTILLPAISFPDGSTMPATKGCTKTATACRITE